MLCSNQGMLTPYDQFRITIAATNILSALPASATCVDVAGSPFFLLEGQPPVPLEPAFEDYVFMLYDTCDAVGLQGGECLYPTLMGDIGFNAVAVPCPPDWQVIIYDRRLSSIIGGGGAEIVIAHELGHIRCGHLTRDAVTPGEARVEELEADAFAGASMQLRGFPRDMFEDVLPILSEQPSLSHPAKDERLVALEKGYDDPEGYLCRR